MKSLALILLCAASLSAQVPFRCGIAPRSVTKSLLGGRAAAELEHWNCVLRNRGEQAVTVREADVIDGMLRAGVIGLSTATVRRTFSERQRLGFWRTLARITGYTAEGFAIAQAGDWISIGGDGGTVIALAATHLPRLAEIFRSRPPSLEGFEQVSWGQGISIGIEPGDSVAVSMWSATYDGPPIVAGLLKGGDADELPASGRTSDSRRHLTSGRAAGNASYVGEGAAQSNRLTPRRRATDYGRGGVVGHANVFAAERRRTGPENPKQGRIAKNDGDGPSLGEPIAFAPTRFESGPLPLPVPNIRRIRCNHVAVCVRASYAGAFERGWWE